MKQVKFDQPVPVFIGLGFPREVASVIEAYDILIEWNGIRDLDQTGAIEVCRRPSTASGPGEMRDWHSSSLLSTKASFRKRCTAELPQHSGKNGPSTASPCLWAAEA